MTASLYAWWPWLFCAAGVLLFLVGVYGLRRVDARERARRESVTLTARRRQWITSEAARNNLDDQWAQADINDARRRSIADHPSRGDT